MLRGWDPEQWTSLAEGRWLVAENSGNQRIRPGDVVTVTEGLKPVAEFRVTEVNTDETSSPSSAWPLPRLFDRWTALLHATSPGNVGIDALPPLALDVETLFRFHVPFHYEGWPPESTTDGSVIDFCWRRADDSLDLVGYTCIDVGPDAFPFRARFSATEGPQRSLDLYIGNVDVQSGNPPRLRDPVLVPVVAEDVQFEPVELIVGRKQAPIDWTRVLHLTA